MGTEKRVVRRGKVKTSIQKEAREARIELKDSKTTERPSRELGVEWVGRWVRRTEERKEERERVREAVKWTSLVGG